MFFLFLSFSFLNDPFYKLTSGLIMSHNIFGPDNNIYLDQILTYKCWQFLVNFSVFDVAWNPYSYSGFSIKRAFFGTTPNILVKLFLRTIALTEKLIFVIHVAFIRAPGFGGLFLDRGRQTNRNEKKKHEDEQKKDPKTSRESILFLWTKRQHRNMPTSRTIN